MTDGKMTTSEAGLAAGRFREGFRADAYECSADTWTFGYGSTYFYQDGERVAVQEGDTITRAEAAALFAEQWPGHAAHIGDAITRPLAQQQFDVLADMAFQFGPRFLTKGDGGTTGLRDAINDGAWEKIDDEIARWHWAGGRRDPGVYTRALSRVCQWHALPWRWLYDESTPAAIKRDGRGRVIETPFMKLDTNGAVLELVTPTTALARARAFDAAGRAKAPAEPRVPAAPAPSTPAKPALRVKAPAGVKVDEILKQAPPQAAPASPPAKAPPAKPRKPVIAIVEPYKPISPQTLSVEDLHMRGIDPAKGAKPMSESERFWGLFWIAAGNIVFQAASRGLVLGMIPGWASFLLVDALRDPIVLGGLASATALLVAGLAAAPAVIRAGIRKLRRGRATASQIVF